ncbi:SLAM family member 5-like isoform X1 [Alligator sinensis]|uniref:SLAM family member 5-like isoform X1 n=1 Tax=Alligator sinensis TaxID=38654 RepID=A0A1U8E032_ALLSI|nr:SLAM family member 5-like isoform X1 [Alligator sinensis]
MQRGLHATLVLVLVLAQPPGTSPGTMSCSPVRLNGILGESVVLPHNAAPGFKRITWFPPNRLHDASGTAVPLAVIMPRRPGELPHISVPDQRYRGKVRLFDQNYSLEVSALTMQDAGKYGLTENRVGIDIYDCSYLLNLYARLPEPEISTRLTREVDGTCNVTFTCHAGEPDPHTTYTWAHPGGGAVVTPGKSLFMQHQPGDEDSPVTCTATNPVSNSSATASPKAACEGATLAPSLSYCRAKGLILLGVLAVLVPGILAVHMLTRRKPRHAHHEESTSGRGPR